MLIFILMLLLRYCTYKQRINNISAKIQSHAAYPRTDLAPCEQVEDTDEKTTVPQVRATRDAELRQDRRARCQGQIGSKQGHAFAFVMWWI